LEHPWGSDILLNLEKNVTRNSSDDVPEGGEGIGMAFCTGTDVTVVNLESRDGEKADPIQMEPALALSRYPKSDC
jgi:hypothetical protein